MVGIAADIEAMFHRVFTCQSDRDALRFLWSDNLDLTKPDVYQMNVHIFGAKSSPTCAQYALRRAASDVSDNFTRSAIETVLRDFYVDDLLTSQPNVEQATSLALELIELLKTSGFRLTKWASNSRQVLSALPSTELAKADIDLDLDEMPVQRILGMRWDTNTDEFTFRTVKTDAPLTKRGASVSSPRYSTRSDS